MIYNIAKEFQELIFEITITKINMALSVKNGKLRQLFFWLLTGLSKRLMNLYVNILYLVIFALPRLFYDGFGWISYAVI